MYAIIETGGKQYRLEPGLVFKVERLQADAGSTVTIDKVLALGQGTDVSFGTPYVDGACVSCEVLEHGRGKKIVIFKKRRRKDSRKKQGHRQEFTALKVTAISGEGAQAAAEAPAEAPAEAAAEALVEAPVEAPAQTDETSAQGETQE